MFDESIRRAAMKRVLKDIYTGLYFKHMDEWTADVQHAANFRDSLAALKFCRKNNLTGVVIVLVSREGDRLLGFHRRATPFRSRVQQDSSGSLYLPVSSEDHQ